MYIYYSHTHHWLIFHRAAIKINRGQDKTICSELERVEKEILEKGGVPAESPWSSVEATTQLGEWEDNHMR